MTCEVYIKPRGSGKTQKIIEEYISDPENTFIITSTRETKNILIKKIHEIITIDRSFLERRILSVGSPNSCRGNKMEKILIDDYLYWNHKDIEMFNISFLLCFSPTSQVKVYTTSKRLYHRTIFEVVKTIKKQKDSIYQFANSLPSGPIKEEALELYTSFLTNPGTTMHSIDKGFSPICYICSREEFIKTVKEKGMLFVSINYKLSEPLLEEFVEEIRWPYYLAIHDISEDFKMRFKKPLEIFTKLYRYPKLKEFNNFYSDDPSKEKVKCEVIGKLFKI